MRPMIGIPTKRGKFLIGSTLPTKKSFLAVEKLFKLKSIKVEGNAPSPIRRVRDSFSYAISYDRVGMN